MHKQIIANYFFAYVLFLALSRLTPSLAHMQKPPYAAGFAPTVSAGSAAGWALYLLTFR